METTTNREDYITWEMVCIQCNLEYQNYSWTYNDIPYPFCCDECSEEYYSTENIRDRKLKNILWSIE